MRSWIAASLCLTLASCATLTKEECLNGNWEEIGFRDGTNGRTSSFIQQHAKACEKTGVVPQQSLWEKGRVRGLPAYCVPAKAYSEGRAGRTLSAVCPANKIPELQAANSKGREYRKLTMSISDARSEIERVNQDMVRETDSINRAFLVGELQMLNDRIRTLERERRAYESF